MLTLPIFSHEVCLILFCIYGFENVSYFHTEIDGRRRLAKEAILVFKTFPTMMQVLVNQIIPSKTLYYMAMANKHFINRLNEGEQTMLKDLRNGYSKCSFIFLYKLVHMSHVLPGPTSESEGEQSDTTVSMRDIDQLRKLRNDVCHSAEASVSEVRFEHFFRTLISIAKRIDECCKSTFEKDIVKIMNNSSMDDEVIDEDIKAIGEIEEMKCEYILNLNKDNDMRSNRTRVLCFS